jgi:hypothetical protein
LSTHNPETCNDCETQETVYKVTLSVYITMSGKPSCHTPASVFANAAAWLDTVRAADCGEETVDVIETVDVRPAA